MELFGFILVLLACVMASSILDQVISRVSLPLIQIAVGLGIAIAFPVLSEVYVDSELFLMLFIAPLLYREARETSWSLLWGNRWAILSMAIALVIVSVLAGGTVLHSIIPTIPLAAAFACAAALGPTDAAAVAALGSTISISKRQSILLSGESLINDASGVVSFQFAISAAVMGVFSAKEAVSSFAVLFFGGIAIGIVMGYFAKRGMHWLRRRGYVSTTVHVIYEVLSPFLFFLAAEELHVSGILAVVAAGLVMQEHMGHMIPPDLARKQMVSNSFWEVIIFLINGSIFVMLGMQLPKVMEMEDMSGVHPGIVLCAMLAVTFTIIMMRFIWVSVMELIHLDKETGQRGASNPGKTILNALVTTIAGPKGAVTLSIIMTIPLHVEGGWAFPHRDLIIFVTSGVILCTLLLADFLLPKLAPKEMDETGEQKLQEARVMVLEGVIREMRQLLEEYGDSEYAPASRLELMRYRIRLMRQRFAMGENGKIMQQMISEVLDVQQARADEIQNDPYGNVSDADRLPYYDILRGIRASVGYFGGAEKVGSRFNTSKGKLLMKFTKFRKHDFDDEKSARIYYDTCMFAIDLERTAIDYLRGIRSACEGVHGDIADLLIEEHEAALQSLLGRINFGQDEVRHTDEDTYDIEHGIHDKMPEGMKMTTSEQFKMARAYTEEVGANALSMELDQIRRLRVAGKINENEARQLREEVYLMQTTLLE